jgi:hypothetical protein
MPGTLQLITVSNRPQRIETFMVQNDTYMLVNPDIVNPIFIGNDPGSQIISVPPLGSVTLGTTNHDTWISTNGGNYSVAAYLLPNGSNWTPSPAQVAAQINALGLATSANQNTQTANQATQIAATNATPNTTAALIATGNPAGIPGGAPMMRYTNNIGFGAAQTLAGGATVTLVSNVLVNQPGYEMSFSSNIPSGAGTNPFASIVLTWVDIASGQTIRTAPYIVNLGNGPTQAIPNYINGPCYGNRVSVQLTNLEPAQTMTYTWTLNQTSHVHLTDNIIQPIYPTTAPITFSWPGGTPGLGVLCMSKPSIGPSTFLSRLLAPYSGKAQMTIDNGGGLNACWAGVVDPTGVLYSNIGSIGGIAVSVPAAGYATFEIALPRGPMMLRLANPTATNTITPEIQIITKDY